MGNLISMTSFTEVVASHAVQVALSALPIIKQPSVSYLNVLFLVKCLMHIDISGRKLSWQSEWILF